MKEINMKKIMVAFGDLDKAVKRQIYLENEERRLRACGFEAFEESRRLEDARAARCDALKKFNAEAEKLAEAIKAAEGRATARTIIPENVVKALCEIERNLGITKKAMEGIAVHVDFNAQEFPSAYKYTPESTWFYAVFRCGSWRITSIERSRCQKMKYAVKRTEESKAALIERFSSFN